MSENYDRLLSIGLGLTLALFMMFGIYWLDEPTRMVTAAERLQTARAEHGRLRFAENCAICHGPAGEGVTAPTMNSQEFLSSASDDVIFSLIRSGVPGTAMPSWAQAYGGPFTDDEVRDVVAFIRSWEPTAPPASSRPRPADPERGAALFASACFACHGPDGHGAGAPAVNERARLNQFDDEWYRQTIAQGRPARGMPTWGTVLSPRQIDDLVALFAAWRRGETITAVTPADEYLQLALMALTRGDLPNAEYYLENAIRVTAPVQMAATRGALALVYDRDLSGATQAVQALLAQPATGDLATGQQLYTAHCEICHGAAGAGGVSSAVAGNPNVAARSNRELTDLILGGHAQGGVPPWQGRPTDVIHLVSLLRGWSGSE
jgi:cytochrome c oxidase cbb3-type subunit III